MMEIYGRKAYRRRIRKKRGSSMVLNHQSCSILDSIVGLNKKSFVIFINYNYFDDFCKYDATYKFLYMKLNNKNISINLYLKEKKIDIFF